MISAQTGPSPPGTPRTVTDLYSLRVDYRYKGFGPATYGHTLRELLEARLDLFGGLFIPPVMVLREAAIEHNIESMSRYCADNQVLLAPHGKTTLAPQLFHRQLRAGAWAITVATPAQVALCREYDVKRVLLANQLVDQAAISWISRELDQDPTFDFYCYVDSRAGVLLLEDVLEAQGAERRLPVLVEQGYVGGRTGCRTTDEALDVAAAVRRSKHLSLRGVSGYEGSIGHARDAKVLYDVRGFLAMMRRTIDALIQSGLAPAPPEPFLVSAGGSTFFDEVVGAFTPDWHPDRPLDVVLRAGCYVTHDSGAYELGSPFTRPDADPRYSLEPALAAWGQVLSSPEPGLSLISLGKRDVPFDMGLPVPTALNRGGRELHFEPSTLVVASLNDQHAFIRGQTADSLQIGDWLECGISHPCSAMDRWQLLPVVDVDHKVVDFIRTFF